jgi:hypothetical protein
LRQDCNPPLERIQANLARFPDNVWIRVLAGDVYKELSDYAGALEFYISAMKATTDPSDWDVFLDRAMEVLQKQGRIEKCKDLQRQAPRPTRSAARSRHYSPPLLPPSRAALPTPLVSPDPFPKGFKIEVSDPCPCGSGKKHKKCCKR